MTSETGKQIITIKILPNISRRMKFGQLVEHNMRNIFLEKLRIKCGERTSPRVFFKKLKLSMYLDQQSKGIYSSILLDGSVEDHLNIQKLRCWLLAFT